MGLLKPTEGMTTMRERPTPETDAHMLGGSYSFDGEFARKLERERDEALKQCVELKAMREAIKEADTLLSAIGYLKKDMARSKLQPFLND